VNGQRFIPLAGEALDGLLNKQGLAAAPMGARPNPSERQLRSYLVFRKESDMLRYRIVTWGRGIASRRRSAVTPARR
jgi:hypothetical protein